MSNENKCQKCASDSSGYCPICEKTFCENHASLEPSVVDPNTSNVLNLPGVLCEDCRKSLVDPKTGKFSQEKIKEIEETSGVKLGLGWGAVGVGAAVGAAFVSAKLAKKYHRHDLDDLDVEDDDDYDDES